VVDEEKRFHAARNIVLKKRGIATIIPIPLQGLCRVAFCGASNSPSHPCPRHPAITALFLNQDAGGLQKIYPGQLTHGVTMKTPCLGRRRILLVLLMVGGGNGTPAPGSLSVLDVGQKYPV
jgi:hypothetical protein